MTPRESYCPTCNESFAPELSVCPTDGSALVQLGGEADPLIDRDIDGRFHIQSRLGAGGMGAVYTATQSSIGRPVALKVILGHKLHDRAAAKRFLREARLTSQIAHPNVVMVLDFGQTEDGILYIAMELVRGRTLSQVLDAEGPLGWRRALRIAGQLCDALDAAHRLGIIHRDLKPSNVIVLDEPYGKDFLKVLDFGLAKSLANEDLSTVTESGAFCGTPAYMPPELPQGIDASPKSDLYALGVMLFEMLAGELPFQGSSSAQLILLHATEPAPPLPTEAPAPVHEIVARLLAKAPADRFASAAEARVAIARALGDTVPERATVSDLSLGQAAAPVTPVPSDLQPSTPDMAREAAPRQSRLWAALAAIVLIGIGFAGAWLLTRPDTPPERSDPLATAPTPDPDTLATAPTPQPDASPTPSPAAEPAPASEPEPAPAPEPDPEPAPEAAPEPEPEPEPEPTAAPSEVAVEIRSDPKGVLVYEGRKRLGRTPFTQRFEVGEAPIKLRFVRAGYVTERRELVPTPGATLDTVALTRRRAAVKPDPEPTPDDQPSFIRPDKKPENH